MPRSDLKYLQLRDFSPGIISNSELAGYLNFANKPGAAQETNTYRCIALPGGGLGPLPSPVSKFQLPVPISGTGPHVIVGLSTFGPLHLPAAPHVAVSGPPDVVFVAVENLGTGTSSNLFLYRVNSVSGTISPFISPVTTTQPLFANQTPFAGRYHAAFMDFYMKGSPFTEYMILGWDEMSAVSMPFWGPMDLVAGPAVQPTISANFSGNGPVISHESRLLNPTGLYLDETTTNYRFVGVQRFFISDPPLNDPASFPNIATEVFYESRPFKITSWGSISTAEIVLIRSHGGAILIEGDLLNPNVIKLPGVMSTGRAMMPGIPSLIGLLYAVEKDGIWVWNGSNLSQKISNQLRDDSFERPTLLNFGAIQGAAWGRWCLFPNNFLYASDLQSWWRIEDPSLTRHSIWAESRGSTRYCWSALDSYTSLTNDLFVWDRNLQASSFSWQSHSVLVAEGRMVDVRELILYAVSTTGGTVKITLTSADGSTTNPYTFNIPASSQPTMLRLPASCKSYGITVRIESSDVGSSSAPLVLGLDVGWETITHAAAV